MEKINENTEETQITDRGKENMKSRVKNRRKRRRQKKARKRSHLKIKRRRRREGFTTAYSPGDRGFTTALRVGGGGRGEGRMWRRKVNVFTLHIQFMFFSFFLYLSLFHVPSRGISHALGIPCSSFSRSLPLNS